MNNQPYISPNTASVGCFFGLTTSADMTKNDAIMKYALMTMMKNSTSELVLAGSSGPSRTPYTPSAKTTVETYTPKGLLRSASGTYFHIRWAIGNMIHHLLHLSVLVVTGAEVVPDYGKHSDNT